MSALNSGSLPPSYPSSFSNCNNGLMNKTGQAFQAIQMDIDFDLLDSFSEVSWTQKFRNQFSSPVEAVYSILLPVKTAICRFIVTYDGKKLSGIVKESSVAVNQYEDSIASGGSGFLVQKSDRTDVNEFNISIGNIPAHKEVKIELSFLALLNDRLNGKMEFEIPIELIPQGINEISVRGIISMTSPVKDIKVNHGIINGNAVVYQGVKPLSNYILSFQLLPSPQPFAILESDPESKSQAIMMTLYPKFPESSASFEPKIESIFVVDRSGSMAGDRIKKTSEALNVLIHALPSDSYFNIVGFGTSEEWLFPESVPSNQSNLKIAETLLNSMQANLGGTDLLTPLRSVFSKKTLLDYPRVIFVLTDGEVNDRDRVIAEVRRNKDCNLYGFGIGTGVDQQLVKGIAEAGRGKAEFVNNNDDIVTRVISLFKYALKPSLSQIIIDWGCNVTQIPSTIPSVMQGIQLVVFGFVKSGFISEKIILSGKNEEGNPLKCPIQITQRKGSTIHKIAAYFLINELYQSDSKKEIIELGLKYQLATKYTSFVAVADNDSPTNDTLQIQPISMSNPPQLLENWQKADNHYWLMKANNDLMQKLNDTSRQIDLRIKELSSMSFSGAPRAQQKSGLSYDDINAKLVEFQAKLFDVNIDERESEQINIEYEKLISELEQTPEYQKEQEEIKEKWRKENQVENKEAFDNVYARIKAMNEKKLNSIFKKKPALKFILRTPDQILKAHINDFKEISFQKLSLIEIRALYHNMPTFRKDQEKQLQFVEQLRQKIDIEKSKSKQAIPPIEPKKKVVIKTEKKGDTESEEVLKELLQKRRRKE